MKSSASKSIANAQPVVSASMSAGSTLKFGSVNINSKYVFYNQQHTFAMVVHNQILPGHVLLCPKQPVQRYKDLSIEQLFELTLATQLLTEVIKKSNSTDSVTISIQEGTGAG